MVTDLWLSISFLHHETRAACLYDREKKKNNNKDW
jgi:hypothetical protein